MNKFFFILTIALSAFGFLGNAQAAEESRPESAEGFIAINPLNVSIVKDARVQGMLQVEIGLDIPDEDLRKQALKVYPKLVDAYIITLRFYSANYLKLYKLPNVEQIADVLQATTDEILQQKGAHVLLSQVMLNK